ncbi:hypothetical protein GCM10010099_20650 [Streptomyces cinereus]|nr:hypothetical protein GCM10010099_20650 [Streptomyces cinereus]
MGVTTILTVGVGLLTTYFQNPLGCCLTNSDKQQLAKLAKQYQCFMVEDDIYAECGHDNQRPLPLSFWDESGYVIWCSSVSKSLSTAYRVGWFVSTPPLQQYITPFVGGNLVRVDMMIQLVLADFLNSGAYRKHLNQLRPQLYQRVAEYREVISRHFTDLPMRMTNPKGGYALWIQFDESVDGFAVYEQAQKQGIDIATGLAFGQEQRYRNCIRINTGHALTDKVNKALATLAELVRQQ